MSGWGVALVLTAAAYPVGVVGVGLLIAAGMFVERHQRRKAQR